MAITIVGTPQRATINNGNDPSTTFDGSPAEDDLVLAFMGFGSDASISTPSMTTAGYTTVYTDSHTSSPDEHAYGVFYKFMGATPDTGATGNGSGDSGDGCSLHTYVLRGVDLTTPIDATSIQVDNDDSEYNPGSITTVTNGAWVFVIASAHRQTNAAPNGAPSGYSGFIGGTVTDTDGHEFGSAYKEVAVAGAEDPGAFSDSGGTFSGELEGTVAIRPAGAGGGGGIVLHAAHHYKMLKSV